MKEYTVVYQEYQSAKYKEYIVLANNSYEAYCKVIEIFNPYGAYVDSYKTKSGKVHNFNNHMGKAY